MMTATETRPSPEGVYAKTEAGRAEVRARALGLSSRQRTLLIVLDGRYETARLAVRLATLMPAAELFDALERLLELGLVASAAPGSAVQGTPAPPISPALAPWLDGVRQEMKETAETYLGLMASDVVRRIDLAVDAAQLHNVLGHWHMAMRDSKRGRPVAEACLERIQARLRAGAAG